MMALSELETGWDTNWDRSTEELRQLMLEVVRQDNNLREGFIKLLKQRFGKDYARAYPFPPLAEEHKKAQELQGTQDSSVDDIFSMEKTKIPLGNFVEQLACITTSEASSEPVVGVYNFVEHVVCDLAQKSSCDSWGLKPPCVRKSQCLKWLLVKQCFHRARFKKRRREREHHNGSTWITARKRSMKKDSATMDSSWCIGRSTINKGRCAGTYLVVIYSDGSNMSEGITRMNQELELTTNSASWLSLAVDLNLINQLNEMERSKRDILKLESICEWVTFEALPTPFKNKYNSSCHLEDKMELLGASNSKYRVLVSDSEKKRLMKIDTQMMSLVEVMDALVDSWIVGIKVMCSCGIVLEKLIHELVTLTLSSMEVMTERFVKEVELAVTDIKRFGVRVDGNQIVRGKGKCTGVLLGIQGVEITEEFLLCELGSTDVILGYSWLKTLGDMRTKWGKHTLSGKIGARWVTIVGDYVLSLAEIFLNSMERLLKQNGEVYLLDQIKAKEFSPKVSELEKGVSQPGFKLEKGLLYKDGPLVITRSSFNPNLMDLYHSRVVRGHEGALQTEPYKFIERVEENGSNTIIMVTSNRRYGWYKAEFKVTFSVIYQFWFSKCSLDRVKTIANVTIVENFINSGQLGSSTLLEIVEAWEQSRFENEKQEVQVLELKFKSVKSMCGWVYDKGRKKLKNDDDAKNREKTGQLKELGVKWVLASEKLCMLRIEVKRAEVGLRCLLRSYLTLREHWEFRLATILLSEMLPLPWPPDSLFGKLREQEDLKTCYGVHQLEKAIHCQNKKNNMGFVKRGEKLREDDSTKVTTGFQLEDKLALRDRSIDRLWISITFMKKKKEAKRGQV